MKYFCMSMKQYISNKWWFRFKPEFRSDHSSSYNQNWNFQMYFRFHPYRNWIFKIKFRFITRNTLGKSIYTQLMGNPFPNFSNYQSKVTSTHQRNMMVVNVHNYTTRTYHIFLYECAERFAKQFMLLTYLVHRIVSTKSWMVLINIDPRRCLWGA